MIHSSSYNSQSQGLVERAVQSVKNLLKKASGRLTQLELSEMVFALNAKESNTGSNLSRFMGRGLRTHLPNSLDRSVNFRELIKERRIAREKRVRKRERIEGKKLIFVPGEEVWIQCPKTNLWNIKGKILSPRTAADGTILSYEVEINVPGGGSYKSTRHRRFMRRYVPESDAASSDSESNPDLAVPSSLRSENDDIEAVDIGMNGSNSNNSPNADRMVTRAFKRKQGHLMNAKKVRTLPDSAVGSHVGVQGCRWVTTSHYGVLREGGPLVNMALDACKRVCKYLHLGYSIMATIVIVIQAICLGMFTGHGAGHGERPGAVLGVSEGAPRLSSDNVNLGIVSWSNINEQVEEQKGCECPEVGVDGQVHEAPTLFGVFEYAMIGTLGTLTSLILLIVGFHCVRFLLKEVKNSEDRRNEHRIIKMEAKLVKMKKKRSDAAALEMGNAADGSFVEVS